MRNAQNSRHLVTLTQQPWRLTLHRVDRQGCPRDLHARHNAAAVVSQLVQSRWLSGGLRHAVSPRCGAHRANHHNIFRDAGVERSLYKYYKADTRGLDFEGMIADLQV